MSVSESMYLSTGRRPSELASRTRKCAACISSSLIESTQWTTSAPSTSRDHPGHEVHALEHERPALLERPLDRRAHAEQHVLRLLDEPDEHRSRHLARRASAASKLEKWIEGMKSRAKNARIVWRTKSVEVTRVIPSR